jgi:hypothetical protein
MPTRYVSPFLTASTTMTVTYISFSLNCRIQIAQLVFLYSLLQLLVTANAIPSSLVFSTMTIEAIRSSE